MFEFVEKIWHLLSHQLVRGSKQGKSKTLTMIQQILASNQKELLLI